MRSSAPVLAAILVSILFGAGCPSRVMTTDGDDVADAIQVAYCVALFDRGCLAGASSVERCEYGRMFEAEAQSVNAGRARVNREALSACLDEMSCGPLPASCFSTFVGTVASGQRCGSDSDCVTGLHCAAVEGGCGGACTTQRSAGESCLRDAECGGGTLLDQRAGSACVRESAFLPGVCGARIVELVEEGDACGNRVDSPTLMTLRSCRLPQLCRQGVCTVTRPGLGEDCREGVEPCAAGLVCQVALCVPSVGLGEPCSSAAGCDRQQGLECLGGGCVPMPDEPGDLCLDACTGGLRCINGLCDDPSPLHGACVSNRDCADGVCSASGLCVPACLAE